MCGQRIGDAGVVDSGGESVGAVVLHVLGNVRVVGEGLESLSMLAQSNAVAPPGRRLRALSKAGSMPVRMWQRWAALVRRAVVTRA